MKITCWSFLLQLFIHLPLNIQGFQKFNLNKKPEELLNESSNIEEEINQEIHQYQSRQKDNSEHQIESNESSIYQMNKFWNSSNGLIKFKKSYLEQNYPKLVIQFNELILSNPQTWYKKMNQIFEKIELMEPKRDILEQIALFQIVHHLINCFKVDLKVIHLIWGQLLKMRDIGKIHSHRISNKVWWIELDIIMRFYESKMIQSISLFESGRDLTDFKSMQRELGEYGVSLTAHWSPEDRKELFVLWLHNGMELYSKLKWNPKLQNVIETQVVQTNLIKSFQKLPLEVLKIGPVYLNWARSVLIDYSSTVVGYIKTLRHGITMRDFISWQILIQPYGLKTSESLDIKDQIKIIKFWSTYVDIFLMIEISQKTRNFKSVIEDLVIKAPDETNMIMRIFLENIDNTEFFNTTEPILITFLRFFVIKTNNEDSKELALKALQESSLEK